MSSYDPSTESEKKNRWKALGLTTGTITAMLVALLVTSCWKAPGPPWPGSDFGILVDVAGGQSSGPLPEPGAPQPTPPTETTVDPPTSPKGDIPVPPSTSTPTPPTTTTQPPQPEATPNPFQYKPGGGPAAKPDPNPVGGPGGPGGGGGGGGGGDGLSISGWGWQARPNPTVERSGTIVFDFVVTPDGELRNLRVVSSTFTPSETNALTESFRRTKWRESGAAPTANTPGQFTWQIVAR